MMNEVTSLLDYLAFTGFFTVATIGMHYAWFVVNAMSICRISPFASTIDKIGEMFITWLVMCAGPTVLMWIAIYETGKHIISLI